MFEMLNQNIWQQQWIDKIVKHNDIELKEATLVDIKKGKTYACSKLLCLPPTEILVIIIINYLIINKLLDIIVINRIIFTTLYINK